jgi:hypothetical protein
MGTFSLDLNKFISKTKANADQVVRQSTMSVLSGVVKRSPVDTGRFRGNWQVSPVNPITSEIARDDKTGSATIASGLSVMNSVKAGGVVWITNNLPYARRLENGWSDQAPQGMVRLTVQEYRKYVQQAIARLP